MTLSIPRLHDLVGVHTVGEVERRRDVDIVGHRKRCTDGNLMTHGILPVLDETLMHDLTLLSSNTVGQSTGIAYGDLLVPTLRSNHLLALEGIEALQADIQAGQRKRQGAVSHVLCQVEGRGEGEADIAECT